MIYCDTSLALKIVSALSLSSVHYVTLTKTIVVNDVT